MVAWIDKEPATSTETETFMSDVPLAYQDGLVVRGRGLLGHLLEASHWERLMFLTEKDIQSQFQKNLKFANKIDIATDGQHRGRHWKPWKMLSGSRNGQKSGSVPLWEFSATPLNPRRWKG